MPLYEYRCTKCDRKFEFFKRKDGDVPSCPSCGSGEVKKLLSTFSACGVEVPSGGSGCSTCGSSSCSSCG